jgi:hypothetical protein
MGNAVCNHNLLDEIKISYECVIVSMDLYDEQLCPRSVRETSLHRFHTHTSFCYALASLLRLDLPPMLQ